MEKIRNWLISKLFIDAAKQIEKTDWMTKALEICFKNKIAKQNWQRFIDGVLGLLYDAIDEANKARTWK